MSVKKQFNSNKSLIISLLIHLSLFALLLTLEKRDLLHESKPIDITFVAPTEPTQDQLNTKNMQIVDQSEKSTNDDTPEDAKFLSRHNQKIAEETKAVLSGKFNNDAGQGLAPKGKTAQAQAEKPKQQPPTSKTKEAMKKSEPAPWEVENEKTSSGLPTLNALKPKFDWNKLSGAESQQAVQNPGNQSATNDYLKNMKTGSQTLLNTREFVYFSYYNRIKNQLQQYWEPKIKDKVTKLFRQGRQIASDQDRITRVRITLNDKGTLVGVAVLGESGVQELDEAAIEAFRAAAPFPNPPKGIVDPDGTIKIDWSFILEAGDLPIKFHAQRFEDLP